VSGRVAQLSNPLGDPVKLDCDAQERSRYLRVGRRYSCLACALSHIEEGLKLLIAGHARRASSCLQGGRQRVSQSPAPRTVPLPVIDLNVVDPPQVPQSHKRTKCFGFVHHPIAQCLNAQHTGSRERYNPFRDSDVAASGFTAALSLLRGRWHTTVCPLYEPLSEQ
jgi:hypothetical protein